MKKAVVTGATSDIGKAICSKLAKEGYELILLVRNISKAVEIYDSIGVEYACIETDLSNVLQIESAVSAITSKYSEIDLLINAAAIWHDEDTVFSGIDFVKYSSKVVLDTVNVGFIAPVILTHRLIPLMRKKGVIVNISGTFENGAKGWLPYYLSKKGIENLTVGLKDELQESKITVFCISPSDTATEPYLRFFPQFKEQCVTPEDIAKAVLKGITNKVNGEIIVIKKAI